MRRYAMPAFKAFLVVALAVGLLPSKALARSAEDQSVASGSSVYLASDFVHVDGSVIPERTPAKTVHDANEASSGLRAQSVLPSSYSSVDAGNVTPVRDQNPFGTCWAFSTIAAVESSLLAHGQVADAQSLDLSERHLAYFTYHAVADPLGNTTGDKTMATGSSYGASMSDPYLSTGGNNCCAGLTLATWQGAADEASAPYQDLVGAYYEDAYRGSDRFLEQTALDSSTAYALDRYHLEDMRQIATADVVDVKRAIAEYGAAAVLINSQHMNYDGDSVVLYNHATADTDHGVVLVGWDDAFSRDRFGEGADRPKRDGAWLAKNSWGPWFGEGGYFWISYEDYCLNSSYSKAYVFGMGSADDFDNNYQYDGSTGDYYNYLPSGGSIANVFTAAGNPGASGAERLDAVSFALDDVNVDYSVQVYVNPTSAGDPASGTAALASPVTGRTTYEGYYTVDLPKPVYLHEGDVFAVVVTLFHANGGRVNYCVDATGRWKWGVDFTSRVSTGQSFERSSSGSTWHDLASSSMLISGNEARCAARVKAFTSNISESEMPSALLSQGDVTLGFKSCVYDGEAKKPSVKVAHAGRVLAFGTDYTVSYRDNKNAGTASVVVTGKGGYSGVVTRTFSIEKAKVDLSGISLKGKSFAYNGQKRSLAVSGKLPSGVKVAYSGNGKKAVGSYTVKATFTSNDPNRFIAKADAARSAKLRITQGKQALSVAKAQLSKFVSFKKLKGAARYTGKVVVGGAKTKLTYKRVGGSKRLSIGSSTGKIRVAKGSKKGVYKIKVKASAANDKKTYAGASKTFTVSVRVK